jgi:hypothetical protein
MVNGLRSCTVPTCMMFGLSTVERFVFLNKLDVLQACVDVVLHSPRVYRKCTTLCEISSSSRERLAKCLDCFQ